MDGQSFAAKAFTKKRLYSSEKCLYGLINEI
jgi:serine/threonine protein kinase